MDIVAGFTGSPAEDARTVRLYDAVALSRGVTILERRSSLHRQTLVDQVSTRCLPILQVQWRINSNFLI